MFPLLAIAATPPKPEVDVAYCARYYNQGKKPSYDHLYICRHDGTGRRQLTFGAKTSEGPMWLDHDHLAFDGRQVWTNELYSGDWTTRKQWQIATGLVFVTGYQFRPEGDRNRP